MDVKIEGIPRFSEALTALARRMDTATGDGVNDVLQQLAMQERTLLNQAVHPRGTKTGSPPGSPPWRITGRLRDSVTIRRAQRIRLGVWSGQMGPRAVYARIQELGGTTGRGHRTHLPPRPHLYPAWRIVRPTMNGRFAKAWAAGQAV